MKLSESNPTVGIPRELRKTEDDWASCFLSYEWDEGKRYDDETHERRSDGSCLCGQYATTGPDGNARLA